MNIFAGAAPRLTLVQSFAVASLVIICGVLSTWVYLKRSATDVTQDLPRIEFLSTESAQPTTTGTANWIASAEEAYAAGRIIAPEADNALYYFSRALEEAPDNSDAISGLDRVSRYLKTAVETALYRSDWESARTQLANLQAIDGGDAQTRLLAARINRLERIEQHLATADRQFAASRLTAPDNDNAVSSYRQVLNIDPDNAQALQGLRSITERLLGIAQSAALAGEPDKAARFIAKARSVDPQTPGLVQAERLTNDWQVLIANQQTKQRLESASQALQEGRLVGDDGNNALALFNEVLNTEPESEAARQGRRLVARALVDQAWTDLRAGRFGEADKLLNMARSAGASSTDVDHARHELAYQRTVQNARAGQFDRVYSINELTVKRREIPQYPRTASGGGWVTVNFTVSENGSVIDAQAIDASSDVFVTAALSAIRKWRFEPQQMNLKPIPVRSEIRFAFEE